MITDGMKTEHVAMVMEIWNAIMQEEVFFPRKRLESTVNDLKILKDMLENYIRIFIEFVSSQWKPPWNSSSRSAFV